MINGPLTHKQRFAFRTANDILLSIPPGNLLGAEVISCIHFFRLLLKKSEAWLPLARKTIFSAHAGLWHSCHAAHARAHIANRNSTLHHLIFVFMGILAWRMVINSYVRRYMWYEATKVRSCRHLKKFLVYLHKCWLYQSFIHILRFLPYSSSIDLWSKRFSGSG